MQRGTAVCGVWDGKGVAQGTCLTLVGLAWPWLVGSCSTCGSGLPCERGLGQPCRSLAGVPSLLGKRGSGLVSRGAWAPCSHHHYLLTRACLGLPVLGVAPTLAQGSLSWQSGSLTLSIPRLPAQLLGPLTNPTSASRWPGSLSPEGSAYPSAQLLWAPLAWESSSPSCHLPGCPPMLRHSQIL